MTSVTKKKERATLQGYFTAEKIEEKRNKK